MSEKILVVDDEHDIADLLEVYLRNENYTIYKYYSAKEALACIESKEIDLAILDIMLPDINGFSICQKIREKHTYPIIMLTAKDEETDKITGLTLGAKLEFFYTLAYTSSHSSGNFVKIEYMF